MTALSMPRPPDRIVCIAGTNASGKSSLGVKLAQKFGGRVISADSRQIYRGLDLGSGKLTAEEMAGVRHYLIDVAEPNEFYTLSSYQRDAYAAIDQTLHAGAQPFLVGGTGLYISAVTQGFELLDTAPDHSLRAELEQLDGPQLQQLLREVDPAAVPMIQAGNRRRLIRAIEIGRSGEKYSQQKPSRARYESLILGLTWPSEILKNRISVRLQDRLEEGLVNEVRRLLDSGVTVERLDSFGLEYRFVLKYLSEEFQSYADFIGALETAIYQFARRQIMWLRRDSGIRWLDCSGDYESEAQLLVAEFLA